MKPALRIQVPASTANVGPGFDSVGIALSLYLMVEARPATSWQVEADTAELAQFPADERNFIIRVAQRVAQNYQHTLPPCHLKVSSEIPLARGLGSSAAAIVAGVELANRLAVLNLSEREKLANALEWESHPDNLAPAIFGGIVVTAMDEQDFFLQKGIDTPVHTVDFVLFVPDFELKTEEARHVLPASLAYPTAVKASAYGNLLAAALMQGNWKLVGEMMTRDLFHQPYRKPLLPHYLPFAELATAAGAYGTAISGAGPATLALLPAGKGNAFCEEVNRKLPHGKAMVVTIDSQGCRSF